MKTKIMLKISARLFLLCSLFLLSPFSHANFKLDGKLELTFPSGEVKKLDFPLSYVHENYEHTFVVGQHTFDVTGQPESYSFALLLKNNNYVWLQEFSKKQFKSFDLTLGDNKLKLVKRILKKPVKGDYILTINGKDYFFQHTLAQINFAFDDDGISEISVDGMVASLGINTEANPCEEFEEGSEERKECEFNN